CLISRPDHAAIRPTAIRQKFGCREKLSTPVAEKMEDGCASRRRRWSTIGTIPTAAIICAPHRQRAVARRIPFFVSRLVPGLDRISHTHLCALALPGPRLVAGSS